MELSALKGKTIIMKSLLVFTLVLTHTCFSLGQSLADSLREEGQLDAAIEEYEKLFLLDSTDNDNTYNLACALALNEQASSAINYLELALKDQVSVRAFNDPDFYFLIDDLRWDSLRIVMIEKVETTYGVYKNRELSIELWTMKIKDQAFYYHENLAKNKIVNSAIWELKSKLNEENLTRLHEIIDTHGWPTTSMVGASAASTVFLIVQHADLETQKKYLPMMKAAADNGEASWSSLALLIDRIEMREGRPQIYGSQIRGDGHGNLMVHEIIDPEYVNQRRAKVGLGPLEDYIKHWDLEWSVKQKEK